MLTGSKIADSTMMSVVASVTSDSVPPMIPAIPTGPSASAMTSGLRIQGPRDVVERLEPLPGLGPADDDPAVADRGGIERVDRLAELHHDVVARVHDVADRTHAGGLQAHLDPVGRRTDRHVAHPAPDEPRAELRLADLDRQSLRRPGGPARRHPTTGSAAARRSSRRPRGPGRRSTARRRDWA